MGESLRAGTDGGNVLRQQEAGPTGSVAKVTVRTATFSGTANRKG